MNSKFHMLHIALHMLRFWICRLRDPMAKHIDFPVVFFLFNAPNRIRNRRGKYKNGYRENIEFNSQGKNVFCCSLNSSELLENVFFPSYESVKVDFTVRMAGNLEKQRISMYQVSTSTAISQELEIYNSHPELIRGNIVNMNVPSTWKANKNRFALDGKLNSPSNV